jgi:hypothetical protein
MRGVVKSSYSSGSAGVNSFMWVFLNGFFENNGLYCKAQPLLAAALTVVSRSRAQAVFHL